MADLAVLPPVPVNAGMIPVMNNEQLDAAQAEARAQQAASTTVSDQVATGLAGYIRSEWDTFKRHRDSSQSGWSHRLLSALRAFNGQYEPSKIAEIAKFGGSQIYARIIAMKCRGASSLLRDVYLNADRPWGFAPPGEPEIPVEALRAVMQKVEIEMRDSVEGGQPVDNDTIRDRTMALLDNVKQGLKRKAVDRTNTAEDKLDDLLQQGGFYKALAEFIVDLPLFPFACIKGPTVKIFNEIDWQDGKPVQVSRPRLTYGRISPFDIWFTPGVSDIEDAAVIERIRFSRAELNQLLDLPGYNHEAIQNVLREYGQGGLNMEWDTTDSSRAALESKENPIYNQSRLFTALEYHGNVQGLMLLQYGMTTEQVPDPLRDYTIESWMIGNYVIKAQMSPSPRRRHPYFITSFEKVPGTVVGNALPDILADIQEAANSVYRSMMNNVAISSGPQVVVNDDRLSGIETGDELYPWKRWHVSSDPLGGSSTANKPIDFFQPQDNSANLLNVFKALVDMGDDVSAIPRYLQGNSPGGGAGRTASGLAMLMGNASKILQTVAANIDRDVMDPLLHGLLDMVLLTDVTDVLDGTERLVVKGVAVAMQRETQRSRQLEFLQITANPIDSQIMGPKGRAAVLRSVADTLGMQGADIVPTTDQIEEQQRQAEALAESQGVPGSAGMGAPHPDGEGGQVPGQTPPGTTQDMGPRENTQQRIAGGVG